MIATPKAINAPKLTKVKQQPQKKQKTAGHFMQAMQRFGKALIFPIAVLPFAAVLNRVGQLIIDETTAGTVANWIGIIVHTPGSVVFDNIAIIFAIGVAFGLAHDSRGEAALVGGVTFLGVQLLTQGLPGSGTINASGEFVNNSTSVANWFYQGILPYEGLEGKQAPLNGASQLLWTGKFDGSQNFSIVFSLNSGVLGAIATAMVVAWLYNKYHTIKLPAALAFFGGRRFVPMLGIAMVIPLSLVIAGIWPWAQYALVKTGNWISQPETKAGGAFVYGTLNRLLQPFGLHHILNTFLWFQLPVEGFSTTTGNDLIVFGDINAFQQGVVTAGNFQSGFFPTYLGSYIGLTLALIFTARKENRRRVAGFLGGSCAVAFLTGIDEPLVFSFIFVSPLLWVINSLGVGAINALVVQMGIHLGFGFSAGLIDYVISFAQSWKIATNDYVWTVAGQTSTTTQSASIWANPLWIWAIGAVSGVIYFFVFYSVIRWTNAPTPGREAPDSEMAKTSKPAPQNSKGKDYVGQARAFITALGPDNIIMVDNCATRLRLTLKDSSTLSVNDELIKANGGLYVRRMGPGALQIIVGADVEHTADAMHDLLPNMKSQKKIPEAAQVIAPPPQKARLEDAPELEKPTPTAGSISPQTIADAPINRDEKTSPELTEDTLFKAASQARAPAFGLKEDNDPAGTSEITDISAELSELEGEAVPASLLPEPTASQKPVKMRKPRKQGAPLHVMPRGDKWVVKRENKTRATRIFNNKADALSYANMGAKRVVEHDASNKIRHNNKTAKQPKKS